MKHTDNLIQEFEKSLEDLRRYSVVLQQKIISGIPLSRAQLHLLSLIADSPNRTASQLASELFVTKGAIAQLISSLVTRGLLLKSPLPTDKRVGVLDVTPEGHKVVKLYKLQTHASLATFLHGLSTEEVQLLSKLVDKIAVVYSQEIGQKNEVKL